jgi:hypothetical protein
MCGEPAISLHSHHVSLVQWTTHLLPFTRDLGSNPLGGTYVKPGFSCIVLSRYKCVKLEKFYRKWEEPGKNLKNYHENTSLDQSSQTRVP